MNGSILIQPDPAFWGIIALKRQPVYGAAAELYLSAPFDLQGIRYGEVFKDNLCLFPVVLTAMKE